MRGYEPRPVPSNGTVLAGCLIWASSFLVGIAFWALVFTALWKFVTS